MLWQWTEVDQYWMGLCGPQIREDAAVLCIFESTCSFSELDYRILDGPLEGNGHFIYSSTAQLKAEDSENDAGTKFKSWPKGGMGDAMERKHRIASIDQKKLSIHSGESQVILHVRAQMDGGPWHTSLEQDLPTSLLLYTAYL